MKSLHFPDEKNEVSYIGSVQRFFKKSFSQKEHSTHYPNTPLTHSTHVTIHPKKESFKSSKADVSNDPWEFLDIYMDLESNGSTVPLMSLKLSSLWTRSKLLLTRVALSLLLLFSWSGILFLLVGLGAVICPSTHDLPEDDISRHNRSDSPFVIISGEYYDISNVLRTHGNRTSSWELILGRDVSELFFRPNALDVYCPGYASVIPPSFDNLFHRDSIPRVAGYPHQQTRTYIKPLESMRRGYVLRSPEWAAKRMTANVNTQNGTNKYIIAWGRVYDVSNYYAAALTPDTARFGFFGPRVKQVFDTYTSALSVTNGMDAGDQLDQLKLPQLRSCMDGLFLVGIVDKRHIIQCQFKNLAPLIFSGLISLLMLMKLFLTLDFSVAPSPEPPNKYVICYMPCSDEGDESLRKTIDSVTTLDYPDVQKLLFVVCDGIQLGDSNDRPTARIVLDILGVDADNIPCSQSYDSFGGENHAKVFSGLYKVDGHCIPYIVVVKLQPRGKRDSLLMLLNLLNRKSGHLSLSPLERELCHHVKSVIGKEPTQYQLLLHLNPSTVLEQNTLSLLVSEMVEDSEIMGLTGQAHLSNWNANMTTRMHVYDQDILQNRVKVLESYCGSVTSLPNSCSLYRLKVTTTIETRTKSVPVLLDSSILEFYRTDNSSLAKDEQYHLPSLLLSQFPQYTIRYVQSAKYRTQLPKTLPEILDIQTVKLSCNVHASLKLLSMTERSFPSRVVPLIELLSVLARPIIFLFWLYLCYSAMFGNYDLNIILSISFMTVPKFLEALLLLIEKRYSYIGFLFLDTLISPFFGLIVPANAIWRLN